MMKTILFDFLNFLGMEALGIELRQRDINIVHGTEPYYMCFNNSN